MHHWLEHRVKAHVFLCMLAYYVEHHTRNALAPILFADHQPEARERASIVAPAQPSPAAVEKCTKRRAADAPPVRVGWRCWPRCKRRPSAAADQRSGARAVCSIDVDMAVPPERLRKFRPEVVDWLVESITARSVLQSISVRRRGAGYELVAGLHRLEAARKCGHQTIRAEVYDDLGDDEAKLLQIDENLCRAELSPAERAAHLVERKRLYETLHPETGHGGDRRSAEARSSSHSENLKAFVEDTAAKTGKGRSTIAREAKRGADIREVKAHCAGEIVRRSPTRWLGADTFDFHCSIPLCPPASAAYSFERRCQAAARPFLVLSRTARRAGSSGRLPGDSRRPLSRLGAISEGESRGYSNHQL